MPFHTERGAPHSHYGQTWMLLALLGVAMIIVFTLVGR